MFFNTFLRGSLFSLLLIILQACNDLRSPRPNSEPTGDTATRIIHNEGGTILVDSLHKNLRVYLKHHTKLSYPRNNPDVQHVSGEAYIEKDSTPASNGITVVFGETAALLTGYCYFNISPLTCLKHAHSTTQNKVDLITIFRGYAWVKNHKRPAFYLRENEQALVYPDTIIISSIRKDNHEKN
ncbi:hypothetical protein SAMN05421841_1834 [Chryseobacterium wanjuense]|uniref:Uncharacterized protein n=1 Tax=Chryseobacterium wanjuense TaxID=356305 RepID=A0A1I0QDP1_9FLAO|nr:hypothetical protein SAMN05421841_1834 [Chryseobacterium wanjuense]